jgi:hypothetical protein
VLLFRSDMLQVQLDLAQSSLILVLHLQELA